VKKVIPIIIALVFGCTNEPAARATLQAAGYTQVDITGHEAFMCSRDDSTCTGFNALSPSGQYVEGAVGCGYGTGCAQKGCTIRLAVP